MLWNYLTRTISASGFRSYTQQRKGADICLSALVKEGVTRESHVALPSACTGVFHTLASRRTISTTLSKRQLQAHLSTLGGSVRDVQVSLKWCSRVAPLCLSLYLKPESQLKYGRWGSGHDSSSGKTPIKREQPFWVVDVNLALLWHVVDMLCVPVESQTGSVHRIISRRP